jgi:DNA recombination protein RmuC
VQKKLHQASDTIEKAKARSRAPWRKLKDVQVLPTGEATSLLSPNVMDEDAKAIADDTAGAIHIVWVFNGEEFAFVT